MALLMLGGLSTLTISYLRSDLDCNRDIANNNGTQYTKLTSHFALIPVNIGEEQTLSSKKE